MSALAVTAAFVVVSIVTGGAQPIVPVRVPSGVVPVGAAGTRVRRVVAVAAENFLHTSTSFAHGESIRKAWLPSLQGALRQPRIGDAKPACGQDLP